MNTNDYNNLLNEQSIEWLSATVGNTALSSESKGPGAGLATILGLWMWTLSSHLTCLQNKQVAQNESKGLLFLKV